MTTQSAQELPEIAASEAAVAQYLLEHPDFFEQHPQLLARLRLHHPRQGTTISLIERQVDVMRQRYEAQERKLAEFVSVARANDQLSEKIHRFTRRLLHAGSRAESVEVIETSLREDFAAFHAVLLLPGAGPAVATGAQGFVRSVPVDDPALKGFESLFASGKPRCGQIRDTQREFLFGAEGASIGSVALIPLTGVTPPGLLALGSVDRDRFHPGMSTDFLARMAELIADALAHE
ncbi:MAG TPA: DUF484 family protein [Steroidobacteraceae bacterium]|nr:DUF484 family protein [Steroidobacteraceae bacterium]